MNATEERLSELMQSASTDLVPSSELPALAAAGGARRLRRRHLVASTAVVAVVGAIAALSVTVAQLGSGTAQSAAGRRPSLYADPPTGSDPCSPVTPGSGEGAPPSRYPQLLMLPAGQSVTYAFENTGTGPDCAYFPHIALTLEQASSATISRSVEIDGPNALTPAQAGISPTAWSSGVSSGPGKEIFHWSVHGDRTLGVARAAAQVVDVYWSGSDGSRWHAHLTGMTASEARRLLNEARYDPRTGVARLSPAAAKSWTVAPAAPDFNGDASGVFYALWTTAGSRSALTVAPGPDRITQESVRGSQPVTISGHPAVLSHLGRTFFQLRWQPAANVSAWLTMTHSSPTLIEQTASSIAGITPTDPRLYRP